MFWEQNLVLMFVQEIKYLEDMDFSQKEPLLISYFNFPLTVLSI